MAVRVLTVDDQVVFRRAAEVVIDASPGFELAGEAGSGEEGLEMARRVDPDLILLDVHMPGMDGVETARRITSSGSDAVVVLITVAEPPDAPGASTCGAARLVSKRQFGSSLLRELWADHGSRTEAEGSDSVSRSRRSERS